MRRMRAAAWIAGVALACGHGEPQRVTDIDFGRLAPAETGPVDQARERQQDAREQLARAKLAVDQARYELQLAQADVTAAEADESRARVVAEQANESREPGELERAARLKDVAQLHRAAASGRSPRATR